MRRSTRQRLVDAAMSLFAENGYDATSVEDIAARAGTGRTTFFRHFPTKDDVVFPDHDTLLAKVEARLQAGSAGTYRVALREATRIILDHYLAEGETARSRYELIRSVPTLRDRELATVQRYVRLFRRYLREWLQDEPDGMLRADLLAATVTTAHNYALRDWLRDGSQDPVAGLEHAMDHALRAAAPRRTGDHPTTIIVTAGDSDVDSIVGQVRRALTG